MACEIFTYALVLLGNKNKISTLKLFDISLWVSGGFFNKLAGD